jgi:hypothetical protein
MVKTYFEWAEFCSTKSGIKVNTKFNLNKGIPDLIVSYSETFLLDNSIEIVEDISCSLGTKFKKMTKELYRVITVIDFESQKINFTTNIFEYTSEDIA